MLASLSLTAMLALAPESDAPSVAVLPLVVEGKLPDVWREAADERLNKGLTRGSMSVTRLASSSCTTIDCAGDEARDNGASYGVWAKLSVESNQRDYAFVIKAVGAGTSNVIATVEGKCDLCGFEEAVEMVEAKAAALPPAIERLSATNPVVAFTSTPDGVEISVDGDVVGTTPLEVPLSPGKHRVRGTKDGFEPQTIEVDAVEGVRKELGFSLVAIPDQPKRPKEPIDEPVERPRGLIIGGAVLTSLGVAGAAAGATLLGLNGRSYKRECEADSMGNCRQLYNTVVIGSIPTAIGSAAFGAGVAMLVIGTQRARGSKKTARVFPAPGGVRIRF